MMGTEQQPTEQPEPTFGSWMGSMWLYTILRFGLFGVLWLVLWLLGLTPIFAALIAIVLSVPLAFVLLARPRARFAAQLEQRVNAARQSRAELDKELSGEDEPES